MSESASTADEVRQRLYEIMKRDDGFENKARDALSLGTEYLGVDSAFVSRIETNTDHYEVLVSTDRDKGLMPEGMTTDLSGTYCRHTLERDSPLALHDVENQDVVSDLEVGRVNCYHGTTLTVENEPYGTVCFVSKQARQQPFTEAETMFAELVGRLLEHELTYERQREELSRRTSLVNVLDRVLRHNIRNDMTVIRAYARLGVNGGCGECEKIVGRADDLIQMSETARDLGKLINTNSDRRRTDVATLLRDLAQNVHEEYPDASVTVDAPTELYVSVLPGVETALWELLENAAEYAGETPRISLSVTELSDAVEFVVSDDGPGIPESEKDSLQAGTETPLIHGSGLGLWTVYWVAANHHGELDITTDDGTTVTLCLPKTSTATETASDEPLFRRAPGRYRAVFETVQVPIVLFDDDRYVVDANDQAGALLGWSADEMTGRRLSVFLDEDDIVSEGAGTVTFEPADSGRQSVEYQTVMDALPGQHLLTLYPEDAPANVNRTREQFDDET